MKKKAKSSLHPNNFLPKLVKNKGKTVRISNPLTNTPAETPRKGLLDQEKTITEVSIVIQPQGNTIDLIPEIKNDNEDINQIHLDVNNKNLSQKDISIDSSEINKFNIERKAPETTEDVQYQLDSLQELQNHIFQLIEIISYIVSNNYSQIITETNLNIEANSMYNQFRHFYSCATNYFNALYKMLEQSPEDRKSKSVPLSDVKSVSFSFCEKWKEIIEIFKIIEENCLLSLSEYILIKFKTISNTIAEITANNRKDTVHAETLLETSGKLRQLINRLNHSIQEMLQHTSLHNLDKGLVNVHITDIKAFIQVYNNAHFREFPKSGWNSIALSQYKSSVIATFSDIIKGLKVCCAMKDKMVNIFDEVAIIQKYLNSIVSSLDLPQTIIKAVAKSPPRAEKVEDIDPLEKIKQYVGGTEVSVVVCSKIEDFIENIQLKLALPFDSPKLNVWDRLNNLQKSLFRKIELVHERENDIEALKRNITEQGQEMAKMIEEAQEKNAENAIIQKELTKKVNELTEQLEKVTKERDEALLKIEKKDNYIHDLKNDKVNLKNKECLEKIGLKMGQMMNNNEKNFEFHKDDDDIQDVDKMSVFVVQKRCKTCKEFKLLQKQLNDALKGVIDFKNGESILSVVNRLTSEVTTLRNKNEEFLNQIEKLSQTNQSLANEIQILKKAILNVLLKSSLFDKDSIEGKTPDELLLMIIEVLKDIERRHQEELKQKEKEMLIHEAEKLREISEKIKNKNNEEEENDSFIRNNILYLDKSTSTIFDDSNSIAQDIISEIKLIKDQLKEKQKEIESKNMTLKKIHNWMSKMSQSPSNEENMTDRSFDILMKAVENRPNPLKASLSKATSELNHVGSELLLFATRMDGFLDQKTPPIDSEPLTVLNYILKKFEGLFKLIEKLNSEKENFLSESKTIEICLRSICKQAARLNEIENFDVDNLSLTQLAYQGQSLIDDLGNLDEKKRFIPVCEVNLMTKNMRKIAKVNSIDPMRYLPLLSQCMSRYYTSLVEIDKFESPLNSLFGLFDFKRESVVLNSDDFFLMREHIFELNAILGKMPDSQMTQSLVHVLKCLIAICSFLISSVASIGFGLQIDTVL